MKTFKDLMVEAEELLEEIDALEVTEFDVTEGKRKIKKVVKDKDGKFHKKITFKCGEGQKYNPSSKKCEHISGSQKQKMKIGAKKRGKTLKRKPQSRKDKDAKLRAMANSRFGL